MTLMNDLIYFGAKQEMTIAANEVSLMKIWCEGGKGWAQWGLLQ